MTADPTRLIVFDWDGTLMDSEARIVACLQAAIRETGLEPRSEDQLRNIIGLGLREALMTLYPDGSEAEWDALVHHYRHHFLERDDTPSMLFEGAEELIRNLYGQGHFLAIATGKGRQGLDKVLEETGLKDCFHATRCADESFSKPHPGMLLDILDRLGVEADDALMVGDTEYDLLMARNAGVPALGVTYGVHDRDRLLRCQPLDLVDSLPAVGTWLDGWLSRAA